MLINLSNHHSQEWDRIQIEQAQSCYGSIIDIEFPNVDPNLDYLDSIAKDVVDNCLEILSTARKPKAVHVMGELTLSFYIVSLLLKHKIKCIASTTKRVSSIADNIKTTKFEFVKFREYLL